MKASITAPRRVLEMAALESANVLSTRASARLGTAPSTALVRLDENGAVGSPESRFVRYGFRRAEG